MQCCHKLNDLGVTVRYEISKDTMEDLCNFDVVVVMAHLDEATDELVLANSRLGIPDFLSYIPDGFCGFLDFSSCHSSLWNNSVKEKCPNCKVSGAVGQTNLPFRLFIYPYVIQMFLSNDLMSYEKAYCMVQDFVKDEIGDHENDESNKETTTANINLGLGNKMSSIFAPTKVVKGKTFMVQLMLYDESESLRRITIQAKRYDPESRHVETQLLPIDLTKGDRIAVQFNALSIPTEQISIDNAVKEIKWNGVSGKIQFNVLVKDEFLSDSFVSKLLIEVNHKPVGELSFRIQVSDKENLAPSPVNIKDRNSFADAEEQREKRGKQLKEKIVDLDRQIASSEDEQTKRNLMEERETCKRLLKIKDSPIIDATPNPRRVFISSTCEEFMKPFRKTVRNVVNSLKMEPVLSDDWPQSGQVPTDVCCQKVMDSDIYVGIFGGRYGHIDPTLDLSMTQIEYYTAIADNKHILLFIVQPLNKTDEPDPIKKRQADFVKRVKDSRILHQFVNEEELSEKSRNDLLDIIARKEK
jgi:hypothetical protein